MQATLALEVLFDVGKITNVGCRKLQVSPYRNVWEKNNKSKIRDDF